MKVPDDIPKRVDATTRSLIAGLKDHDEGTWNRLVRLYTPLVHHWCQKHGLPADDIPDVVQEVFKAVSENIGGFRKEKSRDTFRGWLRVITRNKAMDLHRQKSKEPREEVDTHEFAGLAITTPPETASEDGSEDADAEANTILFRQALELIRDEFRTNTWQAFWLVVVEGLPPSDVAAELNLTPGAVRVAKCRVLQRLRRELGDLDDK